MSPWLQKVITHYSPHIDNIQKFWDDCKQGVDHIYTLHGGFSLFLEENTSYEKHLTALDKVIRDDDFWMHVISDESNDSDQVAANHLIQVYNRASVLFDIWEQSPEWMRPSLLLEPTKYGILMEKLSLEDAINQNKYELAANKAAERSSTPPRSPTPPSQIGVQGQGGPRNGGAPSGKRPTRRR